MDEELIIVETEEIVDGAVNIEDIEQSVDQEKNVEYIEINEPEEINIELEETTGWAGGDSTRHYSLYGRNEPDQHIIQAITGLEDRLNELAANKNVYALSSGFAEFREWIPRNIFESTYPNGKYTEKRDEGYFVSLINASDNNVYLDICRKDGSSEVYGVTVGNSGFCGYQSSKYKLFVLDPNKDEKSEDYTENSNYAKVCLLGSVNVRVASVKEWESISIGDYVISDGYGYATKSNDDVGFRVITKGQWSASEPYVGITLIPQGDNISRLLEKIQEVQSNVGNISLNIGGLNGVISDLKDSNMELSTTVGQLGTSVENVQKQTNQAITEATQAVQNAQLQLETMATAYSKASASIDDARKNIENALLGIETNEKAIQNLLVDAGKYNLGPQSPTYGIDESPWFMTEGDIYVCTQEHSEGDYEFETNGAYVWSSQQWIKWEEVYPNINYTVDGDSVPDIIHEGDLWYCVKDIYNIDNSKILYDGGSLYLATSKGWILVAKSSSSRSISLIRQTAQELSSTYTTLEGEISNIRQTAKEVSSTVENVEGRLTEINQTAEKILMGAYNPDEGGTSLELLLNGMNSTSVYTDPICIMNILSGGAPSPADGNYYTTKPKWNGTEFEFSITPDNEIGEYYFIADAEGNMVTDKYYQKVGDGYRVYTINNTAIANLNTRVSKNESVIESLTSNSGSDGGKLSETFTSIIQTSDAERAEIASIVHGKFQKRVEIKLNLTEEDIARFDGINRYDSVPEYINNKFDFSGEKTSDNGKYCFLKDKNGEYDTSCYYQLLLNDSNKIIGYEKYKIESSPYASVVQKVENEKSYIGLVAEDGESMGSIVARTINDKSEVLLSADKIGISGTAIFTNKGNGATTISGDHISTGVLKSENYHGPATYRRYGLKLNDNKPSIIEGASTEYICFASVQKDQTYTLASYDTEITYYWHPVEKVETSVKIGDSLTSWDKGIKFTADNPGFIVSTSDFDLFQDNLDIEGTKFDLNAGTIFSKNLTLERNGDLTITGRITATSGYIGSPTQGFTIEGQHKKLTYIVSKESLYQGAYCFQYNGQWYSFTLGIDLHEGAKIDIYINSKNLMINDEFDSWVIEVDNPGENILKFEDETYYCLYHNQRSYIGNNEGGTGIFISPEGIGLGNGKFYVDCRGNVSMYGNIVLGGSITWEPGLKLIQVLYSVWDEHPPGGTGDNAYIPSKWHDTYRKGYKYACYSYDGGNTWTNPIKIEGDDGEDGSPGLPGSDAEVTYDNVFNALTDNGDKEGLFYHDGNVTVGNDSKGVYINATYIKSGILSGIKVLSEDTDKNQVVMDSGSFRIKPSGADATKFYIGTGSIFENNEPYMIFGQGTSNNNTDGNFFNEGIGYIYKGRYTGFMIGMRGKNKTSYIQFVPGGDPPTIRFSAQDIYFGRSGGEGGIYQYTDNTPTTLHFDNTTVTGLKITFN